MRPSATLVVLAVLVPALCRAQEPAFDCSKATGEVEQLICRDTLLAALDRNLRVDMQHEIRSLQRSLGQTVIYVTHDQE